MLMSGHIKVSFQEGLGFVYSRVGALWILVTALLWGLWYLGYLVGQSMMGS